MEIVTDEQSLLQACKSLEAALSEEPALSEVKIEIVRLDNFDSLPEASSVPGVKATGACYRKSTGAISLNWPVFGAYSPAIQASVIAHELGHAYVAHTGIVPEVYNSMSELAAEEAYVDRLACLWGHEVGLRAMRLECYGQEYAEALDQWRDEPAYAAAMRKLWWKKLAGI